MIGIVLGNSAFLALLCAVVAERKADALVAFIVSMLLLIGWGLVDWLRVQQRKDQERLAERLARDSEWQATIRRSYL